MNEHKKTHRTVIGKVISDKRDKTITVEVQRTSIHPLLKKVMRSVKKYTVHDPHEVASIGDVVEIYEGRPVSKTKYMYLDHVVKSVSASE
ncbi:MAG: 30S ribosomal protein S17 [Candidatus Babeliaceae bacterium]